MRIHITGNSGSGKTTLAAQLGQVLDLPVFGLDKIVWQSGWKMTEKSVRRNKELELASKPNWIIEGVSARIRQSADIIIFLDVNRLTSLKRSMGRNTRYLFQSRPEMPDNCPEIFAFKQQFEIIRKFKHQTRPGILTDIEQHREHGGSVFILGNSVDADSLSKKIMAEIT